MSIHVPAGELTPALPTATPSMQVCDSSLPALPRTQPRPTATATVADQLRRQILSGRLAPGQLLHQQHLAATLGVSRMPVSHAFARLEAEGLVVLTPHRFACAQVATVSADDLEDLFEIRLALESRALRRAIPRHTAGSLSEIRRLLSAEAPRDEPRGWIPLGQKVSDALYAAGAQSRLAREIQWRQQYLERYGLAFGTVLEADRRAWVQRLNALVDAVASGEEALALSRLADNLETMAAAILPLLARSAGPERPIGALKSA